MITALDTIAGSHDALKKATQSHTTPLNQDIQEDPPKGLYRQLLQTSPKIILANSYLIYNLIGMGSENTN